MSMLLIIFSGLAFTGCKKDDTPAPVKTHTTVVLDDSGPIANPPPPPPPGNP